MPLPGQARPAPLLSPAGLGAFASSTQVDTSKNNLQALNTEWVDWPPYVLALYSARMNGPASYAQWEPGVTFTGHFLRWDGSKPIYSSPDDDMVAYLDDLGQKGDLAGFWAAYYLPAQRAFEGGGLRPEIASYGQPGPWMTGRFAGQAVAGALKDLNGLTSGGSSPAVWAAKILGLAPEARVTQHVMQKNIPLELPLR